MNFSHRFIVDSFILRWLFVGVLAGCVADVEDGYNPEVVEPTGNVLDPDQDTPMLADGVPYPIMRTAADAELADDHEVVGIVFEGQARAYSVSAMARSIRVHVLNDVVGKKPLTVTYCDRNDCVSAFTKEGMEGPLDLSVIGWMNKEMHVGLWEKYYGQKTKKLHRGSGEMIPLDDVEFVRTSWKEWVTEHPDTVVYVGDDRSPVEIDRILEPEMFRDLDALYGVEKGEAKPAQPLFPERPAMPEVLTVDPAASPSGE